MTDRRLWIWAVAGVAGAVALAWSFPRLFPYRPEPWSLSRAEARTIALERLLDVGPPVAKGYVVVDLVDEPTIERRLQRLERQPPQAPGAAEPATLRSSPLAKRVTAWQVVVYPPGATAREWAYRATLSLAGEVLELAARVPAEAAGGELASVAARDLADGFLVEQGYDLATLREPETRTRQRTSRTDTTVRYRYREQLFGEDVPYGVEVQFAGDRLTGLAAFLEDPIASQIAVELQPLQLLVMGRVMITLVLVLITAVPFLRRYHAGEIGVRRGVQIFGVLLGSGALLMALSARALAEDMGYQALSRAMTTWAAGLQMSLLFFLPLALLGMLSWAVGESMCRERWSAKLAAFDALCHGDLANATVARSALIGTAAGIAVTGLFYLLGLALRPLGVVTLYSFSAGPWWPDAWAMGIGLLLFTLVFALQGELFGRLFLLPLLVRRAGPWWGPILATFIGGLLLWTGPLVLLPISWTVLAAIATAAIAVVLFLAYDLLTTLLCALVGGVTTGALPLLFAEDPSVQFQGCLALLLAGLPFLSSLRSLASEREFEYRYDDIPPHVRRIAERERQRVELETARNIQATILPDLPPRLAGVDLAHCYLPASEVGGDFYDCLALEDGRLAVAVGDVAGHGVSSGLVMAMTRSALAVQVSFDPGVAAVFTALNRVVHQSARKRLLATLCYALLDPVRRELVYASAGHLFPYRVTRDGRVHALESVAYPLGVRPELRIDPRKERLDPEDTLVLFSDGVPEARGPRGREDDEQFGFDRLEASLRRHAGQGPERMRDGILDDLREFTGDVERVDDLTLLVLRLPA